MSQLAIFGGEKVKNTPFGTGKRFGGNELKYLEEALNQNTLFYWHGKFVKTFTAKFAEMYGMPHCVATTSGTASIHVALGTLGIAPGDEVIVPPITDQGSVIGILYQNAIPVFADVLPNQYSLDPADVERKITDKTKAIIVVHLAGNPADMDPIMALAKKYNLKVIEDCAQSYMCYYKGRLAGTIGDIGCFSTNNFKHISTGDGGMVVMRDEELYLKALRFADKNYNRLGGYMREFAMLAPNYRMSELQGAVGLAQLERLEWICSKRNAYGDALTKGLKGLKGLYTPAVFEGCKSSYWFYLLRVNAQELGCTREEFSKAMVAEGIANIQPVYIPRCVYESDLFTQQRAYPGGHCPFDCKQYSKGNYSYGKGLCPTAEAVLSSCLYLGVNEFFTEQDLQDTLNAFKKVHAYYQSQKNKEF